MPGLNLLEKDRQKIDSKYFCTVCLLLLNSPMQTSCGHLICYMCLETILNSENSVCPEDGTQLTKREVFPDAFTRRELMNLQFHCPNEGCEWYGTYKDFQEEHEANCAHFVVNCVHEQCQKNVTRGQLAAHLENECQYRQVTCKFCKEQLSHVGLEAHLNEACASRPVTCQYCGKNGIPRDQLKDHETKECDKVPVECDFRPLGCKYDKVVNREELHEHMTSDLLTHLVFLVHFVMGLYRKIEELIVKVSIMAEKWLVTDTEVQAMKENLNTLKLQTDVSREMLISIQSTLRGAADFPGKTENETMHSGELRSIKRQFQDLSTKHGEILEKNRNIEIRLSEKEEIIARLRTKIDAMDESLACATIKLSDMGFGIGAGGFGGLPSVNGTLLWRIDNFAKKRQEAVSGAMSAIYSPHFYSTQFGYKMCVRIYMNGDGFGKGTHISLFFVVMKGEYDALLPWPFQKKITMMILDQLNGDHMIDAFRSDPDSSSFQRPKNKMNIASGSPLFLPIDRLSNRGYVRDDVMFVKVIVD